MKAQTRLFCVLVTTLTGATLVCGADAPGDPGPRPASKPPPLNLPLLAAMAGGADALAAADPAKRAATYRTPGMTEIVKMQESGLEPAVIQSYIENSSIAYRPSADDLVYLHDNKVPSSLVTALIKRGAELRAQAQVAQKESQERAAAQQTATAAAARASAPVPVYTPPAQPVYVAAPPVYAVAAYPSSTYAAPAYSSYCYPSYSYYPRSYVNGGYGNYGYGAPRNFGCSVNLGFGSRHYYGGPTLYHPRGYAWSRCR